MHANHQRYLTTYYCMSIIIIALATYGKTERHLNVRSGEHLGLSLLTGNRVACKQSAISDHLLLHEHNNSSFNNLWQNRTPLKCKIWWTIGLSPLTGNRVTYKPSAISDHLLLHEHNNSSFNDLWQNRTSLKCKICWTYRSICFNWK